MEVGREFLAKREAGPLPAAQGITPAANPLVACKAILTITSSRLCCQGRFIRVLRTALPCITQGQRLKSSPKRIQDCSPRRQGRNAKTPRNRLK